MYISLLGAEEVRVGFFYEKGIFLSLSLPLSTSLSPSLLPSFFPPHLPPWFYKVTTLVSLCHCDYVALHIIFTLRHMCCVVQTRVCGAGERPKALLLGL